MAFRMLHAKKSPFIDELEKARPQGWKVKDLYTKDSDAITFQAPDGSMWSIGAWNLDEDWIYIENETTQVSEVYIVSEIEQMVKAEDDLLLDDELWEYM